MRVGKGAHQNSLNEQPSSLKNNLSNVIVVGLIVAASKQTIFFEVNDATDLLPLCGSVAMLALSSWLIVHIHGPNPNTDSGKLDKTQAWSHDKY